MKSPSLDFRAITPFDVEFLGDVYASTRWEEMSVAGWPDAQKRAFLRQQFDFQTRDWDRTYPHAQREIILVDGEPAGRLYIHRNMTEHDLRVVDIALLPAFRNRGIATRIFHNLFEEGDRLGWKVSIHVEQQNPARHLYTRLGFAPVRTTNGIYVLMERNAAPVASAVSAGA